MTIDEIKLLNAVKGYYFFAPESMRFFQTRLSSETFDGGDRWYFVTSERMVGYDRRYSVRYIITATGRTENDRDESTDRDDFQRYVSLSGAKTRARKAAAESRAEYITRKGMLAHGFDPDSEEDRKIYQDFLIDNPQLAEA